MKTRARVRQSAHAGVHEQLIRLSHAPPFVLTYTHLLYNTVLQQSLRYAWVSYTLAPTFVALSSLQDWT